MDPMLRRIYQGHVAYCCRAVLFGWDDIQYGLRNPVDRDAYDRLWYGVQNLIVGAGNISKALWGTGRTESERNERCARREPLRDSLSVTDSSPFRQLNLRNDYEHLDERIEEWWDRSPNHIFVDFLVGPRGTIGGDALHENDTLRWLDPTTGDVIFWGNELNIPAVVAEAQRILSIATSETEKPFWQNDTTSPG
jgi:hypothetical protein